MNATFTTQSLVQLLQGLADAIAKCNEAQASARAAVAALRAEKAKVDPVILDYTRILRATYGTAVEILAEYGLQPTKARKPPTAEALAAAKAKRKATRAARGTTSRKKKLAVHGDVTGVIVTPVTASTQPASPAPRTRTAIEEVVACVTRGSGAGQASSGPGRTARGALTRIPGARIEALGVGHSCPEPKGSPSVPLEP